jgi:hypothetical protein
MSPSRIILLVAMLYVAFAIKYRIAGDDGLAWSEIINNDGKGYYQYLRGILQEDAGPEPWMISLSGEGSTIKFFCGTAIVQAPYVLVAHLYTMFFSDGPEDGYSIHYQLAILLSALISFLIGLYFTRQLLAALDVGEPAISWTLVALALGTGLPIYAIWHPGMSHIHSFAAIAAAYYFLQRAVAHDRTKDWIIFGVLIGLIILLRPINLAVLICSPLFVPQIRAVTDRRKILLAALATILVTGIQPIAWFLQSGSFIVEAYHEEGFNFTQPALLRTWFSARNGLFFYWPVLLLVFPGILLLWKRSSNTTAFLLLGLGAFAYISSTWWNWSYGTSYGQRNYVDISSLLAVPIAVVFDRMKWMKWVVIPLISLNIFQCWQYADALILPAEFTHRQYALSFLNTDPAKTAMFGGKRDLPPYWPNGSLLIADTNFLQRVDIVIPEVDHGPGEWFLAIEATPITRGSFVPTIVMIASSSAALPASGIRFQLEHVPVNDVTIWNDRIRLRPLSTGDTLQVTLDPAVTSARVKLFAPAN